MTWNWEMYDRRKGQWYNRRAAITITKYGEINLNLPAQELLRDPDRVVLMFDRTKRTIGIRAAENGEKGSFYLRRREAKGNVRPVSAGGFLKQFGIPHGDRRRRINVRYEDGVLIAPLAELEKE